MSLYDAINNDNVDEAKRLIHEGADVNDAVYGLPLLNQASRVGNVNMVKLLLDAKANINRLSDDTASSFPPITEAIYYRRYECANVFIIYYLLSITNTSLASFSL